jgi:hypothetical protein
VQVRANDSSGYDTFRAISVALANFDRSEGHGVGPGNCPTRMIFEPGEWSEFNEAVGSCEACVGGEEFTDGAWPVDSDGFTVK